MNIADRIHEVVKKLPETQAFKVLDFIRSLDQAPASDERAKEAMAALLANPLPAKGDGLPMKRTELYDRPCLR
ncbi:MAG: hypothetical protein HQL82_06465 [Magnetococcales bacterium]|nr:hypothetical protein [Magnetococcales bacterium]